MYQSLLRILKPLVFEGKSGTLHVIHKYNNQARLFIKEGIIDQVETNTTNGKQAAETCAQWISISTSFQEGKQDHYTPDPSVDTNALLSYLEKTHKNIDIINRNISDDSVVFQIDTDKLNTNEKLTAGDLKIAMLFDGKRNVAEVLAASGKSELAVLTHTCRLILSGIAKQGETKTAIPDQERDNFLHALSEKLIDLIGPAGSFLVEDAFDTINSQPDSLAREEIQPLIKAISTILDDKQKSEFNTWAANYL